MPARDPARSPRRIPTRAPEPRERHLRVVDPDARRRARRNRIVARLAFVAVVGAVLLVVGLHVVMAEGQLRMEALDRQATAAQQRYERARLAYAQQATPQAIVERATALGLVPASGSRYLSVPGIASTDPSGPGGPAAGPTRAHDWEKVKSSLVAQP
jgi:hypothetical protein